MVLKKLLILNLNDAEKANMEESAEGVKAVNELL